MAAAMDWALEGIRAIQQAARSGKPIAQPHWPLLILPLAQKGGLA